MIESSIIINNELLKSKQEYSGTYQSSFKKLVGLFDLTSEDKGLIEKCASFTKVRNIVVHEYATLNEDFTLIDYKEILDYFPRYVKLIQKIIND